MLPGADPRRGRHAHEFAGLLNLVQNNCSDVTVEDTFGYLNPKNGPNTDGIDPKDCQRVLIAHCYIDTGDDCIALGGSGGTRERRTSS